MQRIPTGLRLPALAAALVALGVVFFGSGVSVPTALATVDPPLDRSVTCTEFYLDLNNDGTAEDANGDTVVNTDDITAMAISRIEPSQSGPSGTYDITSVLYLGVDTDADAETVLPDVPPDQSCSAARTEAGAGAEVSNWHSEVLPTSQFGNRPVPEPVTYSSKVLTTRQCGFTLGTWVRQDSFVTIASQGPTSINSVDAVLYIGTDDPVTYESGKDDPGNDTLTADDPTDCTSNGGTLPYNTVGMSYGRDVRTDAALTGKNSGLSADADTGTSLDSADGVADDFDGDGCTDWDELDKNFDKDYSNPNSANQRGMDPFNPNDCDTNYNSTVSMLLTITTLGGSPFPGYASDPCTATELLITPGACVSDGFYVDCLGDMSHNTGTNAIDLVTMCYPDNATSTINETESGGASLCGVGTEGWCGNGVSGGGPNDWPAAKDNPGDPVSPQAEVGNDCRNRTDDDGDGSINDGCRGIFGSVGDAHLLASGTYNSGAHQIEIAGCYEGFGGEIFGPNVYADGTIDGRTGAGTMDLWGVDDVDLNADCINGPPARSPDVQADVQLTELETKNGVNAQDARDTDEDGCSDRQELRNDEEMGGLRDPSNPWDFYDTNGDRTISLLDDVFEVAFAFGDDVDNNPPGEPDGYDRNLDRGSGVVAGGNAWNLANPDGTISLLDDVFAVAFQFGHSCSS